MPGPAATLAPLPTGGAVLMAFYGAGTKSGFVPPPGVVSMTLTRSTSGGPFVQLYSGTPLPYWVDVGDGPSTSSQPLDASMYYTWRVADVTGTTELGPVTPGSAIVTAPDGLTQILIRLLQAAVDNAPRPPGVSVQAAQVTTKMPSGGWGAMPFIVVNLALFQQEDTAIGQDVLAPSNDNLWTLPGWGKRVWQISVLSPDADERDFFRDSLLIAFRALKATFFSQIGSNIRHRYQATSGTTGDEWVGQNPGFYWADLMFELDGTFDVTILTGYGLIREIDTSVTTGSYTSVVRIPTNAP